MSNSDEATAAERRASMVVKALLGFVVLAFAVCVIAAAISKSTESPTGVSHDVRSYPCHDPYATHQTTLYIDLTDRTWRSEYGSPHSLDGAEERQYFDTFLNACAPSPRPTGF